MSILKADALAVSDILEKSHVIPRFQRPYSWGKEEIELFYNDIIENEKNYFIGHMVTYKIGNERKGVIDGQQRITTITLALCAIRNKFIEFDARKLADGTQNYIQKKDRSGDLQNILISETSSPFIKKSFQDIPDNVSSIFPSLPQTEEEVSLKNAYDQINNKIELKLQGYRRDDHRKNFLTKLRDKLLDVTLIYVELENQDDAYVIFQTLNSTGKDLDLIDLIKSQLLNLLRDRDTSSDVYKEHWNKLICSLNQDKISPDTFFQHFWVSINGLVTKAKIFKQFKKAITKKKNAERMLKDIIDDSKVYLFIENPSSSNMFHNTNIAESLMALKTFKVRLAHPFILSMLRSYNNHITAKNIRECLKKIEKFHFLYTAITSSRASGISNRYAAYAKRLSSATSANEQNTIVRELKFDEKFPTFEEFYEKFEQKLFYKKNTTDRKVIRYILTQIDKHLKPRNGRSTDYGAMTIEHILSQERTSFGEHIGMIGNLILVDRKTQSKLGAKSLQEKISILHKNGFNKDTFFLSSGLKGKKWIEDRTKKIAEIIYERFTK